MKTIKCPNLIENQDWIVLLCDKGGKTNVSDSSEFRQYCNSKNYKSCNYFKDSIRLVQPRAYRTERGNGL